MENKNHYQTQILKIASRIKIRNKKTNFSVLFDSLEMLEFIENLENEFKIKLDYNYVNKKIFHQLIICQK